MFIDRAKVRAIAGDGGRGCVAFRREKGVPHGGPSGGDGGRGGSIILVADRHMRTLVDFQFRPEFKAKRGQLGMGSQCNGHDAEDITARVPLGTVVRDAETGAVLADLREGGQSVVVARGGKGGRGNMNFATSTRQAPRWAEPGGRGEARTIEMELRLLADVGLVGLPNAGKSLLLSKVSAAHPEVAAYPFTTKEPNLGVVSLGPGESYVVADLPGLIEGAHSGAGLGHEFLRHVSRTRILVHVVDVGWGKPARELAKDYDTIVGELGLHDPELLARPRLVVANKIDMPGAAKAAAALEKHAKKRGAKGFLAISALTGVGVPKLLRAMQRMLEGAPIPELKLGEAEVPILRPKGVAGVRVVLDQKGRFIVRSREAERLAVDADEGSKKSLRALGQRLKELGIYDALDTAGARKGDRVLIGDLEMEYIPD